jgi:hypothetical protein
MKRLRKRFFRVFFIVALLSCIEADAFSYSGIQNYYIELPGENSESGNMLLSDNDSLNHDQIPQLLKHQIVQKPFSLASLAFNSKKTLNRFQIVAIIKSSTE